MSKVFPNGSQAHVLGGTILRGKTERSLLNFGETSSGAKDNVTMFTGAKFDFFAEVAYQTRIHKKMLFMFTTLKRPACRSGHHRSRSIF